MSVVTPTILSEGTVMDASWQLLSLDVMREANRISRASLSLLDGSAARQEFPVSNTAFFAPGKEIEIKLRYEGDAAGEATVFKGLVVRHRVEAGEMGFSLHLELKDKALKLTRQRKSKVFREVTDKDVMSTLISDAGLTAGELEATEVTHPELVQYDCTDWDFMLARADANGLWVLNVDGEIGTKAMKVSGAAAMQFEFGISPIYSFEMEANAEQQYSSIDSSHWSIADQAAASPVAATDVALSQGDLDGTALAAAIGGDVLNQKSLVPLAEGEAQNWANGRMARTRLSLLCGQMTVRGTTGLKLGDVIEILGVGDKFNGQTLVTGIRHQLDTDGWRTSLQFGFPATPFMQSREHIAGSPAAGLLPPVSGLQLGIVDAFEDDPAGELRVKVKVPAIDDAEGQVWARLSVPDGGNERGICFFPEVGDEVVLGFLNDDPRHPVILGALYSSVHAPPIGA